MKYSFKYDGVLSILKDGKPVFEGVGVSTRVNAEDEVRYTLDYVSCDDTTATFKNTERGFDVTLTLSEQLGAMVLRCKATYVSGKLDYRFGTHFYNEDAISINFAKVSDAECFTTNWLGCEFWCRTAFANKPEDLPKEKIQGLLCKKTDGEIFYALPVCDKVFKSLLRAGLNGGLDLYMWSNDNRNSCDTVACVVDFGENAYDLVPSTTKKTFTILGKKNNMREDRRYPETNRKIFKVFNRVGNYGTLAAFNMDKAEKVVRDEVTPADMGLTGDYVCYDWFNKKIIKADHKLQLKNYDDFRLYIFLPVTNGKAFIGLTEKYMSAKTIDYIAGGDWRVNEAGKLGIYSKNTLNFIKVDGVKTPVTKVDTCLYEVEITKDNAVVSF